MPKTSTSTPLGAAVVEEVFDDDDDEYKVGDKLLAYWKDTDSYRGCEILEVKENEEGESEYYIHFISCDRRMDQWIAGSALKRGALPTVPSESPLGNTPAGRTRLTRRQSENQANEDNEHNLDPTELLLEKQHEEHTKVKNVGQIQIGEYLVQTWYYAPYPEDYHIDKLYLCAFCLKYMKKEKTLIKHKEECKLRHPPGMVCIFSLSLSLSLKKQKITP